MTNRETQKRLGTKGEYALMFWNHTGGVKSTQFAFAPDSAAAEKLAREYVAYLPGNQVQVSETGTYPIKVTLRLWNHNGVVKELQEKK